MMNIYQRLLDVGLCIPEISLPQGIDLKKWAVIACDQFTQDRNYWEKVKETAAGAPSTLDLIFPEVFLSDGDKARRIGGIHEAMKGCLAGGILAPSRRGCVYLERDTPFHQRRRGLVAAIDLEQYDWAPSARPLVRSTEGTVPERLPPRMDIRRGAPLETPHILLLIDDDRDTILPALGERAKKNEPVYQTGLMMDSGSVRGWFLDAEGDWVFMAEQFAELARRSVTRYGSAGRPFLFAVGDGNHSLATAKAVWEEYKQTHGSAVLPDHPCRYALVEIENIYDPAIQFEPIHRVVFDIDIDKVASLLSGLPDFHKREAGGPEDLVRLTAEAGKGSRFGLVSGNSYALIETGAAGISTVGLQLLLDSHNLSIDYIHGGEDLFRLAARSDRKTVGILLPPVQKAGLFETVARSGPLPRKSFSMGEACEKRFYLECRKLFG